MNSANLMKVDHEEKSTGMKTRRRCQKEIVKCKDLPIKKSKKERKLKSKKKLIKESRKRTKDQIAILESYYEKDPEWTRKTFVEAASILKIKPIQAYKWGYHKRMKESENISEEKEIETKEASHDHIEKDLKDEANYNEIVGEIVECLSELKEAVCNSVVAERDYNLYDMTPEWLQSTGCILSRETEGRTLIRSYSILPPASEKKLSNYDFDCFELTNVLSDANQYDEIRSVDEIDHQSNIDYHFGEDFDFTFQEFNCISLQEEERILFKDEDKESPVIHFDNCM